MKNIFNTVFRFYYEGFRDMRLGKTLWLIIIVKVFIIFFVLKLIFFPDFLKVKFADDKQKAEYVNTEMLKRSNNIDKPVK
jgi:hypothetical protein